MKANRKIRLDKSGATHLESVVIVVGLLIAIVISVLVYFEVVDSVDQFAEVTETFDGYTRYDFSASTGSNYTGVTITLSNSPNSASDTNVTCWNESGGTVVETFPAFTVNHETVNIGGGAASNFTQVNVTYTGHAAAAEADDITPMAQTVFTLLPIIALVVVAAIIIGIVVFFGGGRRGNL